MTINMNAYNAKPATAARFVGKVTLAPEYAAEVAAALASVNDGKPGTFGTVEDLLAVCAEAQALLDELGLPKSSQPGAIFRATSNVNGPERMEPGFATFVKLLRGSEATWYLVAAHLMIITRHGAGRRDLQLTLKQDKKAVEMLRKRYFVRATAAEEAEIRDGKGNRG